MKKVLVLFFLIFTHSTFGQEKPDVFDIARKGTVEQVKEILKTNPKAFNIVNENGFSPLVLATYRGNNGVAKLLITSGCDINGNTKMGTPLMAAVVKGNNEIAQLLIANKVDVNASDPNGTTALLYAVQFKNYEIISLLIKLGADYNKKDNRGNSAIDYAILADDDKLIELLKNKKL
jgi:ankyrin repeat protein